MPKGREPGVVESDAAETDAADRGTGRDGPTSLAEALELRRNARVGLAVGLGLAALLYVPTLLAVDLHVVGPGGLYLGLGLVLAVTVAGVVTAGLCGKTMLEPVLDRAAWLRRGGTAAVAGGLAWSALPAFAWLAGAGVLPERYRTAATGLAALALVVGTAGLHAAVRGGAAAGAATRTAIEQPAAGRAANRIERVAPRVERAAYWIVVVGLLFAAGNATGNADPFAETAAGPLPSPFLTSAFLAVAAAVPFAAAAEIAGELPPRRIRALQAGALASTLAVAWLAVAGGWSWTTGRFAAPDVIALAIVALPAGLGWAIAGQGLRSLASHHGQLSGSDQGATDRLDN